jgi:UDP-3-O-[3-hydroxymyristoyl] glucosamine N-acyltransferase
MSAVALSEIVALVGGRYSGPEREIDGVAALAEAGESDLSFLENPRYSSQVKSTRAGAVLVPESLEDDDPRWIRVPAPRVALAHILRRWFDDRRLPRGISPDAHIAESAKLGADVAVAPFAFIGDDVVIGDRSVICQGVSIDGGSRIGSDCILYPNVVVYQGSIIGDRCIIHGNAVIGADGYGFAFANGRHEKIPQIGIVRIENDVEIGANSCIDRAALGETVIGEGTKIDNLVQIGHNVRLGRHCLLVSQVGIAGSSEIGDYAVFAGQSGMGGHFKVGDRVQVGAQTAVLDDFPSDVKLMGSPAVLFRDFARQQMLLKKLPKLLDRVAELEEKLASRG